MSTVGLSVHLTVCLCPQHKHFLALGQTAIRGLQTTRWHRHHGWSRCLWQSYIPFVECNASSFETYSNQKKKKTTIEFDNSSIVRRALLSLPQLDASLALGINRKLLHPSFSRPSLFLSCHEEYNASISTDSFFVRSKMNRQNKDYNRLWTKTTSRSTYISLARQIGMTYRPTHR